ncbi:MAG TPA: alpha/beta hydrolase, partial [Casimicrobiaceae bacterium]|nr:alpha/beta hydrolase [Casimicrobiaceae bacterium]
GHADLAGLAAPALVIAGAEDVLFPVAGVAAFAAALRGSRFVTIDGAAHAIHTERPAAFVDAVASFLAT